MFILFYFIFGAAGPLAESEAFESLEACKKQRAELIEKVKRNNSDPQFANISHFVATCQELKKAPQGKRV